jgi:hypothetical protein
MKYRLKIQYTLDAEAASMSQAVAEHARHIPPEAINVTAECYIPKEKPVTQIAAAESVAA